MLSNHYNETRTEYYRQLGRASQSGGDVTSFLIYAVQGFVDQLRNQLSYVRTQQWDVTWVSHVHEHFQHRKSPSDLRRRDLVLDLASKGEPVRLVDLSAISPRVAKSYAGKTTKTVSRDVNALIEMKLIQKTPSGYRACKEPILAFLPPRKVARED